MKMMKIKKARVYNSPKLSELLAEITPLEMEKTKVKMQISARIEELMEQKGWNKSELAEKVGKHPSEITKWMSGTQNFTMEVLTEIAFTLGVDVSVFFDKKHFQLIYKSTFIVAAIVANPTLENRTPTAKGEGVYGISMFSGITSRLINPKFHKA